MECFECEKLREELTAVRIFLGEQLKKKDELKKEIRIMQGVMNGMQKEIDSKK